MVSVKKLLFVAGISTPAVFGASQTVSTKFGRINGIEMPNGAQSYLGIPYATAGKI